ncbi:hypothetical protein AVEN_11686-1 [Araneus ventricosus]|uniref:Uncharacterized protein n=1 Tax=Araneus ventricosus TaxID=182803 RepID=A0A4Y2VH58_ARAVE|nr:hypothetical protein AVEN_11686-1 [Araneus ventricosus]
MAIHLIRDLNESTVGHSPLFQTGIFGTWEGKPIINVENLSNLEQMIRSGGIQKNLKLDIHLKANYAICPKPAFSHPF